jgi:hypothetical protein
MGIRRSKKFGRPPGRDLNPSAFYIGFRRHSSAPIRVLSGLPLSTIAPLGDGVKEGIPHARGGVS